MDVSRSLYCGVRAAGRILRYNLAKVLGHQSAHEIAAGYRHRRHIRYFDDTDNTDEWQKEVYESARALMVEHGLQTVTDVGCGSGYKLVHLLGEFDTTGVDLPRTLEPVRSRYPNRKWVDVSSGDVELPKTDMVICADVIEHVGDPDRLMSFVLRLANDWVVLSTPDRNLAYHKFSAFRFGPPENPTHVREWNMIEFERFIRPYIQVERHEISNRNQATQMVIGRVRK